MNKPLVSIGLPVFNDAKYLKETIDSILNQTYKNIELIIVDDGSTDESLDIINKFQDERIKVYVDGINYGLQVRLNQITKLAKGDYLARMDSDDLMHPNRINAQIKILLKNPNIDVLGSNAFTINETGKLTGVRYTYDENKLEVYNCKSFIHPTIMATKKWFLQNPYNEKAVRIEDAVLWRKTQKNSNFKYTTQPLLYYREMSSGYYKKYFKALPSLWKQFKQTKDFFWVKKYIKSFISGFLYFMFSIFKAEKMLLRTRNQVKF